AAQDRRPARGALDLQPQGARGPAQGGRATDLRRQRGDRGSPARGACRRQAGGRSGLQPHRTLRLPQGSEAKAVGADSGRLDFELNYRMHLRAGRAVKAVLEGAVDEAVRNEAAFRLARIHFQKDQLDDAQQALARIQGKVPEGIRDDVEFLRANIDMATGRPGDAVEVLRQLRNDPSLAGFAAYNLGIALFQDGRPKEAIEQLDKRSEEHTS